METWKIIALIIYSLVLCGLLIEIVRMCKKITARLPIATEEASEDLKAAEHLIEEIMKQEQLENAPKELTPILLDSRVARLIRCLADNFCLCHFTERVYTIPMNECDTRIELENIIKQGIECMPIKLSYRTYPPKHDKIHVWYVKIWRGTEEVTDANIE